MKTPRLQKKIVLLMLASICGTALATEGIAPSASFAVTGDFAGKTKPAEDLSGIACMNLTSTHQRCLVIDDQGTAAQLVDLSGKTITAGATVPLIGEKAPEDAIGSPPSKHSCSESKKFKDLDGEAVAVSGDYFYVVGSHGCGRNSEVFRESAFLLIRLALDSEGHLQTIQRSYRLSDVLLATEQAKNFFTKLLKTENGLNIEGLAAIGDQLFVGLRAPSGEDSKAFIVQTTIASLFDKDIKTYTPTVTVLRPDLGVGVGIRDLSVLPDGRLLVLSGPAQDQASVPFSLWALASQKDSAALHLADLKDVQGPKERAKAEALTVLGVEKDQLRVLVLFDGLPNGGASEYVVPLK